MTVAIISMGLITAGFVAYIYGTITLSRYAFRVGTGHGLAVLLFPPYTLYFAFWGADERGKELPAAASVFGLFLAAFIAGIFWSPVQLVFQGRFDTLSQRAEAASPVGPSGEEDESNETDETSEAAGDGPTTESGTAGTEEASADESPESTGSAGTDETTEDEDEGTGSGAKQGASDPAEGGDESESTDQSGSGE